MTGIVRTDMRDGILIVTLNRPTVLNAVSREMRLELTRVLTEAERDPAVTAVVLTGEGKAFCAGQDLTEALATDMESVRPWCDEMRAMYQSVRALSKPCVTAYHGIAAGAGLQIGLCSDLRVSHAEARIGQPEVRAGLASVVGSYLLSLTCGHGANVELSLTGGLITGARAHDLGIVSRLVPAADVLPAAIAAAGDLRRVPVVAFRLTKQRFRELTQPGFDDATATGVRATFEAYATGEPQRIMRAFVQVRAQRKAGA